MKIAKNHNIHRLLWLIVAVVAIVGAFALITAKPTDSTNSKLQVVAGENFWGSLASQLGGNKVNVTSVVSDPNADPHEYESNTKTARAFTTANYVILNGAGYDSWGDKLLSSSSNPKRKTLDVATLLDKKNGDNPHFWYNPAYVNKVIVQIDNDLISLEPSQTAYFKAQLVSLQKSLQPYQSRIASIKQQFGGTKVAATEDIFAYLAQVAGLDLISPQPFIEAVAEGNDPPTSSVAEFQQQLQSNQPRVLVYNEQTVTPLTENMKSLAATQNIPIVGITETIQPPDTTFETWMNGELMQLENALNASKLGQ
jgi:zinc/manganese transport system substrate-binding protein